VNRRESRHGFHVAAKKVYAALHHVFFHSKWLEPNV
jgi:hypothetical protein